MPPQVAHFHADVTDISRAGRGLSYRSGKVDRWLIGKLTLAHIVPWCNLSLRRKASNLILCVTIHAYSPQKVHFEFPSIISFYDAPRC